MDLPSKLKDNDFNVRLDALDEVFDGKILNEVATNDIDDFVRYKAFLKLRDYYPDSFECYDKHFVLTCTTELLLRYIINDSMYRSPKISRGRPIDKDMFVRYLVLYDDRWEIRACASQNPNLKDENLLKDIVLYDYDHRVRASALKNPNLNIKSLFELMAIHDSSKGVRFEATKRLEDEEILMDIAQNEPKATIRAAAIKNPHLYNERVLINAALNDHVDYVRLEAIEKITNELVLARIAREDKSKNVRKNAKNRLKKLNPNSIYLCKDLITVSVNENDLLKIAKNAIDLQSRIDAVKEIRDNSILCDFALNDSKWRVRKAAAQSTYLVDRNVLATIGMNDSSPRVRKAAFLNHNFCDVNVLAKISANDTNEANRYYALKKLNIFRKNYE